MKKPMNAPWILIIPFAFVCMSLVGLQFYLWFTLPLYTVESNILTNKNKKINTDKDLYYPHQEEAFVQLVSHSNKTSQTEKSIDQFVDMETFMEQETIIEPAYQGNNDHPFLVIAGAYGDETFLISKQAQLQQKGLPAEIIKTNESNYKKLCVGRFMERQDAQALVDDIAERYEIRAVIFDKRK